MALNYRSKLFGGGPGGGGSSLPALTGNTGKVLTVNAGETGTEWAAGPAPAAAGADTQVLFNDGGAIAGNAGFTFQKTTKALSGTGPWTLTPATDIVPLTVRAYSSGTNPIVQFQTSANGALTNIGHDGKWNGDVVGNVTGNVSGTAGDGLTSASGTAPLTLTLAAKALTGSVAEFTGDAGAGGAKGLVPAPAAGDATKFLRGDKTWQTVSGGGGVTNSAGANVITKSDGTNLVASSITDDGASLTLAGAAEAYGLTGNRTVAGNPMKITVGFGGNVNNGGIYLYSKGAYGVFLGHSGNTNLAGIYPNIPSFQLISTGNFGWTNSTDPAGSLADTLVRRRAAANPAWGVAAASPVAYTHSLAADARAGTDSNTRGAKATLTPGNGTGTGGSGDFVLQTAPPGTTGMAANTPADRIVLASKPVTLTESSATAVLNYAVASGTVAGGTVWYTIRADDATDFQSLRGQVQWSAVNKGGTLTASIGLVGSEVSAVSAGTLTNTPTITTGTNSITINLNAVSSLTQTTLYAFISAEIDGTGVATTK